MSSQDHVYEVEHLSAVKLEGLAKENYALCVSLLLRGGKEDGERVFLPELNWRD